MLSLSRAGNFRMVDIRINALTLNLFLKILEPVVSVFEIVYNPSFSNFIWTNFKLTVAKCTMYSLPVLLVSVALGLQVPNSVKNVALPPNSFAL